jgi:hypothetical protein
MHKLLSSQVGSGMTHGSVTACPTPGRRPMARRTSHRTRSATALRFRADHASPQRGPPSAAWFAARLARSSANSLRRRVIAPSAPGSEHQFWSPARAACCISTTSDVGQLRRHPPRSASLLIRSNKACEAVVPTSAAPHWRSGANHVLRGQQPSRPLYAGDKPQRGTVTPLNSLGGTSIRGFR